MNGKIGLVSETKSGIEFEVVLSDNQKPFNVQIKANQLKFYSEKSWDVAASTKLPMTSRL